MTGSGTAGHCNGMWPYHPDLLATPVPRYTSYPTAADFGELPAEVYGDALENVSEDISLYVHIPFCERICFYCGCNTGAAGRIQRLDSYLEALSREIDVVSSLLPTGRRVRRVAFGGGSPNAIRPVDFVRLVEKLTVSFGLVDPVFSIELDPRSMSGDWAEVLTAVGVERASLGVQTFAPHCQKAIGRIQSRELIARSVDCLRDAGVTSLNFDLMYGLPRQMISDLLDTLERTREFGADRIALFGYAHVPHLVPRQRVIEARLLPGQVARFAMASSGHNHLSANGYQPVGFDHFAKPKDPLAIAARTGTLHRNFQGFTDDEATVLIGLGSSAISSFPGLLCQNEKNSGRYRMMASQQRLASVRGIRRSDEDRERGHIIEQILCRGHADLPSKIASEVGESLRPFEEKSLARLDDGQLTILSAGLPYARTIAALFDPYRRQTARRFSSAV